MRTPTALTLVLMLVVFTGPFAEAAPESNANLIAIGQGISSPTSTTTVNFSSGYTSENPLGTIYQNRGRITGQYDRNDNNDAIGAEIGYGTGQWGVAGGYRKPNCNGCDGKAAGALGITAGNFGFGLRFAENLYSAGILFNPQGLHRFGIMGELNNSSDSASKVTAYGLGYSYVAPKFTLTLDASSRTFQDGSINDHRVLVTPGFMIRADIFQLTVNDRITLNRDLNNSAQTSDSEHDIWFGVGIGGERFHLAAYSHYFNKFAVAASLFF